MRIIDEGEEDWKDGDILLCLRKDGHPSPHVPSDLLPCSGGCGHEVWRSKVSPKEIPVMCSTCFSNTIIGKENVDLAVTKDIVKEALRHLRTKGKVN